jgi:hypothetical protein
MPENDSTLKRAIPTTLYLKYAGWSKGDGGLLSNH